VVLAAFGCILALLFVGSLYSSNFLSPDYLLQQLQVARLRGFEGYVNRKSFKINLSA
jgi:hypothetical protein